MAVGSPALAGFPLAEQGLEWLQPDLPLAHPFDDGSAAILYRSLEETCARLGTDGARYGSVVGPLVERWPDLMAEVLQPVLHVPRHPLLLARFGWQACWPASMAARRMFRTPAARALFAGLAAHSVLPLSAPGSAAFGWILAGAAHAVGWPIPRGGSQHIANALAGYFTSLGGKIVTDTRVQSLANFGHEALILCDITPRQFLEIADERLTNSDGLKKYRYGPGAFKIDWALSRPVPWKASECSSAGTLHLGGSLDEIEASEKDATAGTVSERPFVLFVQPSLFDNSRAPAGSHTAWAYCHVPHGLNVDMTSRIEAQVERFAPGFRACILARHTFTPAQLEQHNANLVGGDITGGAQELGQLINRPNSRRYRTPLRNLYICSSSTPPGGGVHGMCGHLAALAALADQESAQRKSNR